MGLLSVLPRPLDRPLPADVLVDLASRAARQVARSHVDPVAHPGGRWHVRLRVTAHYDLWLIGWGTDSRVELHDHGRSAGAISVVGGTLTEHTRHEERTPVHTLSSGDVRAFDAGHVHDVLNEGSDVAISVHVYSPPLTSMTFYDDEETPVRTELVDLPGLVEDR